MKLIFELDSAEKEAWKKTIQYSRNEIIAKPNQYVHDIVSNKSFELNDVQQNVSVFIKQIREEIWNKYILDEVEFHRQVISLLTLQRELPREMLEEAVTYINSDLNKIENLATIVGDYAGRIMPYLYELSLSTTNSRRSRAGTTFEAIINYLIEDIYQYPFENQSQLGKNFYVSTGVGKMVDGIIPGQMAYLENRNKCMVVTLKTTLRERWQEVVEELNRTNVPHIYLLTLDTSISENTLTVMKSHNITVVDYDEVKNLYPEHKNIISFDEFFNREIPHVLGYWGK